MSAHREWTSAALRSTVASSTTTTTHRVRTQSLRSLWRLGRAGSWNFPAVSPICSQSNNEEKIVYVCMCFLYIPYIHTCKHIWVISTNDNNSKIHRHKCKIGRLQTPLCITRKYCAGSLAANAMSFTEDITTYDMNTNIQVKMRSQNILLCMAFHPTSSPCERKQPRK